MSTQEQAPTSLMDFEQARATHTEKMKQYNSICADIDRCEKERQAAIEAGKEAESNWRTRFRTLRGNLTDELRAEHAQRIASRELADEFNGLLEELEIDKEAAMLSCCTSGEKYVASHRSVFTEFADAHWRSAVRNVSPSLLWAIKLRLQREYISRSFVGEDRNPVKDVAELVGKVLIDAAIALPDNVLEEAPVLENIGIRHPALTGVDMMLYNSPIKRSQRFTALEEKRKTIEKGTQQ